MSGFLCAYKCSSGGERNDRGRGEIPTHNSTFGFSHLKHIIANYISASNKPGRFNYSAPLLLLLSYCKSDLPPSVATTICHR